MSAFETEKNLNSRENFKTDLRNNSIDIFRYVCAILVVAVHTTPFIEINEQLAYLFETILPRVAVPFFFAIAGYYYIVKITEEKVDIKKVFGGYIKKLLLVYSIWSIMYIIIELVQEISTGLTVIEFLKQIISSYFIGGSYYHLWFFPALFFAIIVTTFFAKIKKVKILAYFSLILYVIGCFGCSYYEIGNKIPILNELINFSRFTLIRRVVLMGLPFFMMGYYIKMWEDKLKNKMDNKKILYLLMGSIVAFVLEIVLVTQFEIQKNVIITIFLYFLVFFIIVLLLNNPLKGKEKIGKITRGMANFMYYSHPIFILLLNKISFIQNKNTLIFILIVAITSLIGYIIVRMNNKVINKLIY